MRAAAAGAAPRRSWLWLQGAVVGAVAVMLPATAMVAVALLGPALTFTFMETAPGRPVSKVALLTGSAATVWPLRTLWLHGNTVAAGLDILSDPACPALAWIASGSGWLLCELVQLGAGLVLAGRTRRKMAALRREEAELREEWTLG